MKYTFTFNEMERGLMINSLKEYLNYCCREGKPTEDIVALIKKAIKVPARKDTRWGRSEAR